VVWSEMWMVGGGTVVKFEPFCSANQGGVPFCFRAAYWILPAVYDAGLPDFTATLPVL